MSKMKKKTRFSSIAAKIFISMLALILLMLLVLWLSQTVMLSTFYELSKKFDIYRVNNSIADNVNSSELNMLVNELSDTHESCIKVVNLSKGYSAISGCDVHANNFDCILHKMQLSPELYKNWVSKANENDGFYVEMLSKDKFKNYQFNPDNFIGDLPIEDNLNECVISVGSVINEKGETILIITNASIEPVRATVRTIRTQLFVITVIMVFSTFIVAFFVSRHMSAPIVDINNKAKELAKGNYDIQFVETGTIETIELAKTLNFAVEELSKLDSLQKELIANISHDLRTPLTMISGYSEVMRDIPGENTPENMQVIIDETARLSSLVNDLLNVSKLQSGTQKMDIKEINITDVIRKCIERYKHLISHNGYRVTFEAKESVYIMADEVRLLQVVYNLINNAINYTGENKLVKVVQSVTDNVVRVSVIDSGVGISDEDLPLIWDRYFKVDKVHTRAKIGTGLGLSIVKNILLLHGSRFGVSSEVGEGSTFWFEFRIVDSEPLRPVTTNFMMDTSDDDDDDYDEGENNE